MDKFFATVDFGIREKYIINAHALWCAFEIDYLDSRSSIVLYKNSYSQGGYNTSVVKITSNRNNNNNNDNDSSIPVGVMLTVTDCKCRKVPGL